MSAEQSSSILPMILTFGGMFALFYFLLLRPQQKQKKNHEMLITSLKQGDEVLLSSGIAGRIFSIEEKFVILEIADRVKVRALKMSVVSLMNFK